MNVRLLRRLALAAGAVFLAWVVWGVVHAGTDIPGPAAGQVTELDRGHAEGRRLSGPAWSLDYDTIEEQPDGSSATLTHVRHGEVFRNGKPYVSIRADAITVNTLSNDFSATGHVVLVENDGRHTRAFSSQQAIYNGVPEVLTLPVAARIESDGMVMHVEKATVNLKTGDMTLGRIDAVS